MILITFLNTTQASDVVGQLTISYDDAGMCWRKLVALLPTGANIHARYTYVKQQFTALFEFYRLIDYCRCL
jgi:hypothetical protein